MRHPSRKYPDVKTLKPGMVVYLLPIYVGRGKRGMEHLKEAEITKIGRKYVSVKEKSGKLWFPKTIQFDSTNNYLEKPGDYGRDYDLFFSVDEAKDFFLHEELMAKINTDSNYAHYLTTHQLKQICDLLEKGKRVYKSQEFNHKEV